MLDQKIKKAGTVTVTENEIRVSGFDVDNAMCRETAIHALIWAIGELQKEVVELIAVPGGSGKCCMVD